MPRPRKPKADKTYLIATTLEAIERCMEHKQVYDSRGDPIPGFFKFDSAGAARHSEILAKLLGLFVEKQEHGGTLEIVIRDERPKR